MSEYKRRFGDRRDARWIREIDGFHAIMPHLMPKRTDSEVYHSAKMDVTDALRYIAEKNAGEEEYKATLFHCFIMAIARTVHMRPLLNRYISGRRFYARHAITMGFAVKKRFEDHSEETLMVTEAKEDWTLTDVTHKVVGKVHTIRTEKSFGLDNTLDTLKKLPRPLMMFAMWVFRVLDFYGKMPKALTEEDPNYSTVFLTNLGSIKCPSVYHHLNNYGTNSIMVAIGTIHKEEVFQPDGSRQVRDIVDVGVTLDERIADGFYFGRSWKLVQHLLSHPELLERPLKEKIDFEF
jgi:pyruvate/2-oxoglutarate dehydrogenase complex dihydrolipoamide acyltransferase (E2) component